MVAHVQASDSLPVVSGFELRVDGTILGRLWKTESFLRLGLHEKGCPLKSLVGILLVNGRVVLAGVFAAFRHERDEGEEL